MRGGIPKDEQETTITYDSGEKLVRIYTARPADMGKLTRAGIKPISGSKDSGFRYKLPMNQLAWRIKTGKPSLRGYGSRKLHTNGTNTPGKGLPIEETGC